MVGNAPPSHDELRASVRSMEVIRWYVEHVDEVRKIEELIVRQLESAERAGVGKDLNVARETAKQLVTNAEARAKAIDTEAGRLRAQAEETLFQAKQTKAEAVKRLQEIEDLKERHHKAMAEEMGQHTRRKLDLDNRERKIVVQENANKEEESRLKALRQRLEAALKGP